MSLGLNILLIFVFLVIGSVFSGTELALVSLRGSQIEQMEQEDARGAKVAKIARDPNTFLSTVQIGVTLSGFLSASFGASSIAPYLIPAVESWGVHPGIAGGLVNIILTLIISYCSIVISEMVPKRIAMQRTEQIARAVVPAIDAFAADLPPDHLAHRQEHERHRPPARLRPAADRVRGVRRRAARAGQLQHQPLQGRTHDSGRCVRRVRNHRRRGDAPTCRRGLHRGRPAAWPRPPRSYATSRTPVTR